MIGDGQPGIDWLTNRMLAADEAKQQTNGRAKAEISRPSTSPRSDEEIIEKCRAADNAAKFEALFDRGDVHAYHGGDDSSADLALTSMMAFYTQDPSQLESLVSTSALGQRAKWRRRDYRERTIRKALSDVGETYHWGSEKSRSRARGAKRSRADDEERPTDDELRDRFIERRPNLAYGLGTWRRYEGGIWTPTGELKVKDLVVGVLEDAKPEKVRPNKALMSSVSELAKVRVAVEDEVWDADPNILVCANGALDLQARKLLPHSKEHFATARVPYDYVDGARSEVWEERVMGEIIAENLGLETVGFFQEFAGYCLTTSTEHEIALWLTGKHGGGRSTILAGLDAMLGPRAGVLSLSDIERSNFALTNLPGKTLVTATEQPGTYLRGGGVLNAIISGEPIQVDVKFKDPITVVPRCKIAWAMNEVPRVGNPDDGLYRRVKILSIPEIPEEKRDPKVKEEIKASGAAILNWALDGLERLRARGRFEVPSKVKDATYEFKQDNDVTGLFVDEMCTKSPEFWEGSSNLYTRYREWAQQHGHIPMSTTSIAKEWRRLGFERRHTNKGVRWHGVKLRNGSDYF